MYALGIDTGTTSISLALVDIEDGALIDRATVNHAAFIDDGCPVGRVQDADRIADIAMEQCAIMIGRHGRPCCIGLTGQMHGMLYVDGAGRAVSPLYTWQDGRGNLPMADGRSYAEALRARGEGAAAAGFGLTTHYYMRENGLVPAGAAAMTPMSDYIALRLTGGVRPVIGADMAASWGMYDLERRAFNSDDPLLPETRPGCEVIGETPDGVPVTLSVGDNQASFIGAVRDMDDTLLINIGTGSQVSMAVPDYIAVSGDVELRPCGAEGYLLAGSGLCGGRAVALLETFYREAAGTDAPRYDYMLRQAEAFIGQYGADAAWRVNTAFSGTRSNPDARGSIGGIGIDNFHPGALTAGVVMGVLEELRAGYQTMVSLTGRRPSRLAGAGNGLRRNPLMRRFARDLFGMVPEIPAHMEEAAYGAALCAMAASGEKPSLRAAQGLIRYMNNDMAMKL